MSVSEASTTREGQNREPEGTFNHCLNQKIMLSKLNDDSSTNDLWIWLADAYCYVDSRCSMSALDNEIIGASAMDLGECGFTKTACWGTVS